MGKKRERKRERKINKRKKETTSVILDPQLAGTAREKGGIALKNLNRMKLGMDGDLPIMSTSRVGAELELGSSLKSLAGTSSNQTLSCSDLEFRPIAIPVALPLKTTSLKEQEKFVFPWKCIISNLPAYRISDKCASEVGSMLTDILGIFKPIEVTLLHNGMGYTGEALVSFQDNWSGFKDARALEDHFISQYSGDIRGKRSENNSAKICGWVARHTDYISEGVIGDYLRRSGCLMTVSQFTDEDPCGRDKLFIAYDSERENKEFLLLENDHGEELAANQSTLDKLLRNAKKSKSSIQKLQHVVKVPFSPLPRGISMDIHRDRELKGTTVIGCTLKRGTGAMLMSDSKASAGSQILDNYGEETCWDKLGCIVSGRIYVGCSGSMSDAKHMTIFLRKKVNADVAAGRYREEDVEVPWIAKEIQNVMHEARGHANVSVIIVGWHRSHDALVCCVDRFGQFRQDSVLTIGSGSQSVALRKWHNTMGEVDALEWMSAQLELATEMDKSTGGPRAWVVIRPGGTAVERLDGGPNRLVVNPGTVV